MDELDDLILRTIDLCREREGACSLGQLARYVARSKDALRHRLGSLQQQGLVIWTPNVAGSIRRTGAEIDTRPALRDQLIVAGVLRWAALEEQHDDYDQHVKRFCEALVRDIERTVWGEPEIGPDEVAPIEIPEPASVEDPIEADHDVERLVCLVCERSFAHTGALNGHLRSKAHHQRWFSVQPSARRG